MKSTVLRSILLVLLAAVLLVLPIGCGEIDEDEIPENMHSVTLDGAYCRLVVPIDWNSMNDMGVTGAYISSRSYAAIFVHDYENPEGLSPADYAEQVYIGEIGEAYPEGDLGAIATSEDTLDGKTACVLEYEGTRNQVTYHSRVYLCSHRDRIWALTFIAQYDVFEDAFESESDVLANVRTNFRFLDEPWVSGDEHNTVDTSADAPEGMMLASSDDVAYRFYVPDTWVLDTALPTSSAYVSEDDRTNVNVTVLMPAADANYKSVDDYWAVSLEQLKQSMTIVGEVKSSAVVIDGHDNSKIYEYTAEVNGRTYRFAQAITSHRGTMIYTITYTATEENFDAHYADFERILDAFEFR